VPAQVRDPLRLAAVHRTGLLDTGPDEAFDRLTRLAATLLGTPYAFVTLVVDTRSFWKSSVVADAAGSGHRQSPVEEFFCQYLIAPAANWSSPMLPPTTCPAATRRTICWGWRRGPRSRSGRQTGRSWARSA
jgi:hypothetical protein